MTKRKSPKLLDTLAGKANAEQGDFLMQNQPLAQEGAVPAQSSGDANAAGLGQNLIDLLSSEPSYHGYPVSSVTFYTSSSEDFLQHDSSDEIFRGALRARFDGGRKLS